jgi:hypothetical protein
LKVCSNCNDIPLALAAINALLRAHLKPIPASAHTLRFEILPVNLSRYHMTIHYNELTSRTPSIFTTI